MRVIRFAVAIFAALCLMVMSAPRASGQETEVVAEGLNGPQDVTVAPDGSLWIIDSGVGGDEQIEIFDGESGEFVTALFGNSARVVRVEPGGEATDIATLPSLATESGVTGGGGIVLHGGEVFVTVGEWVAASSGDRPEGVGAVWSVSESGDTAVVADTFAHEATNDPYPYGSPTSHPYGLFSAGDELWVADAASNALLSVNPSSGEVTTVAVFEPLPGAFPRPDYDGEMLTDPVPTAVTVGPDGVTYVSLLSGAPFIPGNAKIIAVAADGSLSDYATGLTMLTDLVTGPDGNLYATQFAVFGEQGPDPASGAVVRIRAGGSTEPVVTGLSFTTAIAFAGNGDAYVAVGGAGPPGSGQIVRIAGLAGGPGGNDELPSTGTTTALVVIVGVTLVASGALVLQERKHA